MYFANPPMRNTWKKIKIVTTEVASEIGANGPPARNLAMVDPMRELDRVTMVYVRKTYPTLVPVIKNHALKHFSQAI